MFHCLPHSTHREDKTPASLFHLPWNTVSSIRCGILGTTENLEEEKKAYKALGTPHQVPLLTFIHTPNHNPLSAASHLPKGVTTMQLLIEHRILGTWRPFSHYPASSSDLGRLCCSLSRQWAPFKEQSHKELPVECSAQAQICFLAVCSLPSPQLCFPRCPRCLNVGAWEASFTESRESVPGPCCSTHPCPSRWTLSRACHQLPNQDWLTVA